MFDAEADVLKLRTEFFREALIHLRDMAGSGDTEEFTAAVGALRQYFEWVKDGFDEDVQSRFAEELDSLPHVADRA